MSTKKKLTSLRPQVESLESLALLSGLSGPESLAALTDVHAPVASHLETLTITGKLEGKAEYGSPPYTKAQLVLAGRMTIDGLHVKVTATGTRHYEPSGQGAYGDLNLTVREPRWDPSRDVFVDERLGDIKLRYETGPDLQHATYTIESGTGDYRGATGSGEIAFQVGRDKAIADFR
jgi:hypothetical protein